MTENQRKSIAYLEAIIEDSNILIKKLKTGEIDKIENSVKEAYITINSIFLGE